MSESWKWIWCQLICKHRIDVSGQNRVIRCDDGRDVLNEDRICFCRRCDIELIGPFETYDSEGRCQLHSWWRNGFRFEIRQTCNEDLIPVWAEYESNKWSKRYIRLQEWLEMSSAPRRNQLPKTSNHYSFSLTFHRFSL